MINISERDSIKAVGKTSLFVSFAYDPKLVEIVKQAEDAVWNKDICEWELPLNKLSYLIDNLTLADDITLNLLNTNNEEELEPVINYKVEPFDYQREGIKWMINHTNSLLTDPPGLGKSLQTIYTAEELKAQKGIEHCLIICGINTLKNNWKKEIEKFSSLDCVIVGEKISSKGNISYASVKERAEQLYQPIKEFFVIINIESLRDPLVVDAIKTSKNKFDMVVVDEIHKCLEYNSVVTTTKGKFKIGELVEKGIFNDCKVLCYDNNSGKEVYRPVVDGYKSISYNMMVELDIEDDFGEVHKLKCTPDHLIFTENRGWVEAKDLTEEDNIKNI